MRYHKVSELEDAELHHLRLLQLYMPWKNEDDLKETALHMQRNSNL